MDLRRTGMPSNLESRLVRLLEQQFTVNKTDYEPKPTGVYDWEDDWHILIKKAETFESRELQKILVNREQLRMLEKLLNDAYTIRRPKPSEYENRKQVIRVLNDIAKDLYGYSTSSPVVEEFGSFSMDLFTAESDLDLSINFPNIPFVFPRELKIKTLRKFAKKLYSLQSAGRVQKVETVMGAKVPILKFVDTATSVECDVSVENMDGIAKSLIIRHICSIDERFQKLSLLMKEWAKAHDINSPKDQTLSSLSIILLVAFHLQTRDPPILPPFSAILKDGDDPALVKNSVRNFQNYGRRNTETLGELFVSFLIKLTSVEELWSKGLCASSYLGHWTSKTWDHRIAIMSVEDFYDRAQNVARAVGKIEAKIIHSSIHLTIQNLRRFMNVNIEELKLEESLFGSVYGTHYLLEPNLIFKENYEKRTTQTKVTTNKVYNPNGVMDLRDAPSPSTRQLPTGIWGAGNGAAFMNGWSQETQPATDSWGSRCQQLPYESERRKKEEMERRAKLDEIAEKQRKREEELEEREWLRKQDILGRGTPIDKPLSDLPVPGSTAPAPVAAADGGGGKYVPKFRRSAAASQQRRHRHNHLIGVKVAIHQQVMESERRKKEEMERRAKLDEIAERQRKREEEQEERKRLRKELERGTPIDKPLSNLRVPGSIAAAPVATAAESERRKKEEMERRAKLDEIAERQRKREEELEERERLRKELGRGTPIDKPLSDLPVPGSTAPVPVAAAESERRKKEEMEGRAKLDEIAERQRKREEELEEREWLRKEAILERGTPIDKPLSDLPVPGSTAPAPVAAAGGGGGKYVPKFRRSAAASQQRRHRHKHLIGGEVAIHQPVMESERRKKEEMERRAKLDEIAERQRKREEELEERERLRKELGKGTPIDKPLSDLPVPGSTTPAPVAAVESESRKKEEMERRAKLDEIAERQRKREEEQEEREWLRKEAILERGTPIDKPLSDLLVPGSTAPAPVAAADGGGGKYVPKFRRSAAASQQRRHRHNHLIGGEVAIHQQVMEFERRKKEEMERRAKLDEIAERQRKREEELEERERLRKELGKGTPIDKPLSDLPVPGSTTPTPVAAVESESRKKEEMERRAKLDEIAERQRKREEELEEREWLRKEAILERGTPIDKPLSDLPVPGSTAPAPVAAAADGGGGKYVPKFRRSAAANQQRRHWHNHLIGGEVAIHQQVMESERRKKEEMERRAKLDEIAERQRKREEELEERERLRKEAILSGTPIDKPLSDLPVPRSTAPAPAAGGGGVKYVPRFRRMRRQASSVATGTII